MRLPLSDISLDVDSSSIPFATEGRKNDRASIHIEEEGVPSVVHNVKSFTPAVTIHETYVCAATPITLVAGN